MNSFQHAKTHAHDSQMIIDLNQKGNSNSHEARNMSPRCGAMLGNESAPDVAAFSVNFFALAGSNDVKVLVVTPASNAPKSISIFASVAPALAVGVMLAMNSARKILSVLAITPFAVRY
jgi:hypothetical protein